MTEEWMTGEQTEVLLEQGCCGGGFIK